MRGAWDAGNKNLRNANLNKNPISKIKQQQKKEMNWKKKDEARNKTDKFVQRGWKVGNDWK